MKFKQHPVNSDSAETEEIQSNIKSSNTDGSFTMANLNMFLGLYKILPIAPENEYWGKFSYFIMKLYVCVLIRIASLRQF